jgi:AmmeMemoRadiSam system protein B/AmmeMemoRadiSam system protein A
MGRCIVLCALCLLLAGLLPSLQGAQDRAAGKAGVRPPAVAGRFYSGDATRLKAAIRAYLDDAVAPSVGRPVALIAPHAGYIYSGQIAADAYRQAMDHDYDLVVILGTNHTAAGFRGVSLYAGTGYVTPLGTARIDRDVTRQLIAADPDFTFTPAVHREEHSVEVQVPFVQALFPETPIVTAVIGRPDLDLCSRFGKALAAVLKERRALIVASSDLSHYPRYEDAVDVDTAVLGAVAAGSARKVDNAIRAQQRRAIPNLSTCACGEGPVLAALETVRRLGGPRGTILSYANSGDTAMADRRRVVGYGAVAFAPGEAAPQSAAAVPSSDDGMKGDLSRADGEALLAFARRSIERFLATETAPLARNAPPRTQRPQGVFVTLKKDGELRGCTGRLSAELPLYQGVGAMALQAAFNDNRFPSLRAGELDRIEIEISLLSPLTAISRPQAIEIGKHGVRLQKGARSAVFLPQVAVEQGWDRKTMMERLCRKAGLPSGCWSEGAELHTFTATIVKERAHL